MRNAAFQADKGAGKGVCEFKVACEKVKPDCCYSPAVVSTLLTPLPVSCPLTTPFHYTLHPQRPYGLLEAPISTFTQLLSSDLKSSVLLYVHRDRTDRDVQFKSIQNTLLSVAIITIKRKFFFTHTSSATLTI